MTDAREISIECRRRRVLAETLLEDSAEVGRECHDISNYPHTHTIAATIRTCTIRYLFNGQHLPHVDVVSRKSRHSDVELVPHVDIDIANVLLCHCRETPVSQ